MIRDGAYILDSTMSWRERQIYQGTLNNPDKSNMPKYKDVCPEHPQEPVEIPLRYQKVMREEARRREALAVQCGYVKAPVKHSGNEAAPTATAVVKNKSQSRSRHGFVWDEDVELTEADGSKTDQNYEASKSIPEVTDHKSNLEFADVTKPIINPNENISTMPPKKEPTRGRPNSRNWLVLNQLFQSEGQLARQNGLRLTLQTFCVRNHIDLCSFRRARRLYKLETDQN